MRTKANAKYGYNEVLDDKILPPTGMVLVRSGQAVPADEKIMVYLMPQGKWVTPTKAFKPSLTAKAHGHVRAYAVHVYPKKKVPAVPRRQKPAAAPVEDADMPMRHLAYVLPQYIRKEAVTAGRIQMIEVGPETSTIRFEGTGHTGQVSNAWLGKHNAQAGAWLVQDDHKQFVVQDKEFRPTHRELDPKGLYVHAWERMPIFPALVLFVTDKDRFIEEAEKLVEAAAQSREDCTKLPERASGGLVCFERRVLIGCFGGDAAALSSRISEAVYYIMTRLAHLAYDDSTARVASMLQQHMFAKYAPYVIPS